MDETTPPVTKIYLVSLIYTPKKNQSDAPTFSTSRNRGKEPGGGEARDIPFPQLSTPAFLHGSLSYDFLRKNETGDHRGPLDLCRDPVAESIEGEVVRVNPNSSGIHRREVA